MLSAALSLVSGIAFSVLFALGLSNPTELGHAIAVSDAGWAAVGVLGSAAVGAVASITNTFLLTKTSRAAAQRMTELERKIDAPRSIETDVEHGPRITGPQPESDFE